MEYLNKLKKYLSEKDVKHELLHMGESVATSIEAAKQMGEDAEKIVKSIVFFKNDMVIVVILRKGDRVDKAKVSKALNVSGLSLCSPEETLEKTGYPAGGVPPLGFKAEFLIDEKAAEKEEVIAGGGNSRTLIKIRMKELLKHNNARIISLRREDGH
ncbi:hypothetical protein FJZ53_04465 [Candidatus Woesearchaeota archaeon]|nr:hypothetical protein [Candidatus Woesearchaeota archaeon]